MCLAAKGVVLLSWAIDSIQRLFAGTIHPRCRLIVPDTSGFYGVCNRKAHSLLRLYAGNLSESFTADTPGHVGCFSCTYFYLGPFQGLIQFWRLKITEALKRAAFETILSGESIAYAHLYRDSQAWCLIGLSLPTWPGIFTCNNGKHQKFRIFSLS